MDILAYLMVQQQAQQNPALWDTFNGLMSEGGAYPTGGGQAYAPDVTYNTFEGSPSTTTVNTTVPPITFPGFTGGGGYAQPQQMPQAPQQPAAPPKKEKPKYTPPPPPPIWQGGVAQGSYDTFQQKQGPEYSGGWGMGGAQKPMQQAF